LAGLIFATGAVLFRAAPGPSDTTTLRKSIIGTTPADFRLPDIDGQQVRLSDFRGKTVMLTFWATWCAPCKAELPTVQEIYEEYRDKGLVVLAVNDENQATIREFLRAKHYSFTALVDSKRTAFREFAIHFIPTAIVISPDGIVTQEVTGWEGPQRLLEALRAAGFGRVPPGKAQPASSGNMQRTLIAFSKQERNR
jgi:peroxiredoxin